MQCNCIANTANSPTPPLFCISFYYYSLLIIIFMQGFSRGEQFKERKCLFYFVQELQSKHLNQEVNCNSSICPLDTKKGESVMDFPPSHTAAVSLQTRIHFLSTSLPAHYPLVFSSSLQTTLSFSGSHVSWFIRHRFYWDSLMPLSNCLYFSVVSQMSIYNYFIAHTQKKSNEIENISEHLQ